MKTELDWQQECRYIAAVTNKRGNVKEMGFSKATFLSYCQIQRENAERQGFHDSAQYIQHCIDELEA